MQRQLCYDTIGDLDGGAARAIIDAAIRQAVADLDDRGEDEKPRAVNVVLTLNRMDNGLVAVDVQAEAKLPKRRTAATINAMKRTAGRAELVYQEFAPENPDQRTLDEFEGAKELPHGNG